MAVNSGVFRTALLAAPSSFIGDRHTARRCPLESHLHRQLVILSFELYEIETTPTLVDRRASGSTFKANRLAVGHRGWNLADGPSIHQVIEPLAAHQPSSSYAPLSTRPNPGHQNAHRRHSSYHKPRQSPHTYISRNVKTSMVKVPPAISTIIGLPSRVPFPIRLRIPQNRRHERPGRINRDT
jgi:hypothetical protein